MSCTRTVPPRVPTTTIFPLFSLVSRSAALLHYAPSEAPVPFTIRPYRRVPVDGPVTYQTGVFERCGAVGNVSLTGWRCSGNLLLKERWLRGMDVRDRLLLARMVDETRGRGGEDVETLVMDDDSQEDVDESRWQRREESAANSP